MKSIFSLAALLFLLVSPSLAQDKLLTLDDIFSPDPKVRVRLAGTPVFVQWAPDGRSFRQVAGGRLMRVDPVTGEALPYYDSGSMVAALMRLGIRQPDATVIANGPDLQFDRSERGILLNHLADLWYYDNSTRQIKRLTNSPDDEEKEADFSPDGPQAWFSDGLAEEIGADLWANDPIDVVREITNHPAHRAAAEQRTVGRRRKKAA